LVVKKKIITRKFNVVKQRHKIVEDNI